MNETESLVLISGLVRVGEAWRGRVAGLCGHSPIVVTNPFRAENLNDMARHVPGLAPPQVMSG